MKLIVGLGNPGPEYTYTRHNIGFQILDLLAHQENQKFEQNKKFQGETARINDYILLKPHTFMNLSGKSIQSAATFYKITPQDIWVVHDDVDIEFGKMKIQKAGGSAGHNGIKSIIQDLGTPEFMRWRIGVGKPPSETGIDTADYVLMNFTKQEQEKMQEIISRAIESINSALKNNIIATMNKYN